MKVFISWSGPRSHAVALLLKDLLENAIQAVEAFVSSEDIAKGTRPFHEIAARLESAAFGIVCLTRSNLNAPWLHFEAGALAKSQAEGRVSPLLVDFDRAELQGPLTQFQNTLVEHDDMLRLLRSVNEAAGASGLKPAVLEKAFDKWWPEFHVHFQKALDDGGENVVASPPRSERDMLEEVLTLVRDLSRLRSARVRSPRITREDSDAFLRDLSTIPVGTPVVTLRPPTISRFRGFNLSGLLGQTMYGGATSPPRRRRMWQSSEDASMQESSSRSSISFD